ncbi:uncharacterized protein HMPREF1541_01787 [Cyphellophora europaea CBS 101466]|uniref:Prephenate dehydrogenase [NADP(+)] n=1 Tax=Cyphellophora europaea (strain CBS 101466) TaxID=1220924 RepID=W2S222_CYPE1|nr:uncharacterized protein HMPREF1541_01787 [Cyphellophora europaea CBS 101466]ETN42630.1 hypothetical protein HMPREF1541_01787 [Cyphellophora europaea CBS 101466]
MKAHWFRIYACDLPAKYESLKNEFEHEKGITILPNGHLVSRISDWIIYSVEAEVIGRVVAEYGPSTKVGAIVGGQTSCKAPELEAFDKYLPQDVEIVSCHSLHGPAVDPRGQPLVVIQHRASQKSVDLCVEILSCLQSKFVFISGERHDRITADTQAVTHAAFLSMGSAWAANKQFPWEINRYVGGIENVKINIMMRIYSNKWHVYAGLAILNPAAKQQIRQYAASVTELYKLMLGGHREELTHRIKTAGSAVFKQETDEHNLLLSDDLLDQFSLSKGPKERTRNNHLSLLAIVDTWWKLGIVPYDHMICSTPLFRIWLGVTEYLFRNPNLLDDVISTAIEDNTFRSDDLEFTFAARAWSDCVSFGDFEAYRDRFENIQRYFAPRFPEAVKLGSEMIKTIVERTKS